MLHEQYTGFRLKMFFSKLCTVKYNNWFPIIPSRINYQFSGGKNTLSYMIFGNIVSDLSNELNAGY